VKKRWKGGRGGAWLLPNPVSKLNRHSLKRIDIVGGKLTNFSHGSAGSDGKFEGDAENR
jgi:hypothetical protein